MKVEFAIMLVTLASSQILDAKFGDTKVLDYTIKYEQELGIDYRVTISNPVGHTVYDNFELTSKDLRDELDELAHRMLEEKKVLF